MPTTPLRQGAFKLLPPAEIAEPDAQLVDVQIVPRDAQRATASGQPFADQAIVLDPAGFAAVIAKVMVSAVQSYNGLVRASMT